MSSPRSTSASYQSFFSQQAKMEYLVAPLSSSDRSIFQTTVGEFLPVVEWTGVKLNAKGEVVAIWWSELFKVEGRLNLKWLPSSVISFNASHCCLTGSMSFLHLPSRIEELTLNHNQLSGNVSFRHLPRRLQRLNLSHNLFEGSLDMDRLPKTLKRLSINRNRFTGPLDLRHLPRSLEYLNLSNNMFTDEIFVEKLPVDFCINVSGNPIDQDALEENCSRSAAKLVVANFPPSFSKIKKLVFESPNQALVGMESPE